MFVVTGKEMAILDKKAIEEGQIPELILMENAGLRVVEALKEYFPTFMGKRVIIIAGKGNNGGDGLVIARHLVNMGADVKVFTLGTRDYQGGALVNYRISQKLPIKWQNIENENSLHLLQLSLHYTDLVVDALFGTGFRGNLDQMSQKVIEIVNGSSCLTVAVDIPTGLVADTGKVAEACIRADLTVTFQLPKLGLVIEPGASYAGQLKVADISIPEGLIKSMTIKKSLITKEMVAKSLPHRDPDCHKGDFGHLLLIGGSKGMMGAVNLAARGAFALGAGLVTAVTPSSIQETLAGSLPELMTKGASETATGTLGLLSVTEISEMLPGKSAVVFGPGLGKNSEILPLLTWLLENIEIPLVIDADGLNALGEKIDILKEARGPIILTPHTGEMARLLQEPVQEIQANRWEKAAFLAEKYGAWVVLKGHRTVMAGPGGDIYINSTGSSALATAGTGDVLSGMIGALLGQVKDIGQGLYTSVYVHGLAGEAAALKKGVISCKAGDVIDALPQVLTKGV